MTTPALRQRGEVSFSIGNSSFAMFPKFCVVAYLEEKYGSVFDLYRLLKQPTYSLLTEIYWAATSQVGALSSTPTRDEIGQHLLRVGLSNPLCMLAAVQFVSDIIMGLDSPVLGTEEAAEGATPVEDAGKIQNPLG